MKKMNVTLLALTIMAGSFMVGCSSTTENTSKPNYTGADGTEKTISDGGDVPVQGTRNDPNYIDQTKEANPPGDDKAAPADTVR